MDPITQRILEYPAVLRRKEEVARASEERLFAQLKASPSYQHQMRWTARMAEMLRTLQTRLETIETELRSLNSPIHLQWPKEAPATAVGESSVTCKWSIDLLSATDGRRATLNMYFDAMEYDEEVEFYGDLTILAESTAAISTRSVYGAPNGDLIEVLGGVSACDFNSLKKLLRQGAERRRVTFGRNRDERKDVLDGCLNDLVALGLEEVRPMAQKSFACELPQELPLTLERNASPLAMLGADVKELRRLAGLAPGVTKLEAESTESR